MVYSKELKTKYTAIPDGDKTATHSALLDPGLIYFISRRDIFFRNM